MSVILRLFMGVSLVVLFSLPNIVFAHGGRLDSSGGHNCNVESCEGEYHYHHGGDKSVEYGYPEGSSPAASTSTVPAPKPLPVVTTKVITEMETVEFISKEQADPNTLIGERVLIQEGVVGQRTITYKVTYTDGVETARDEQSNEVTTAPTDEIYAVGAMEKPEVKQETQQESVEESATDSLDETTPAEAVTGLSVTGAAGYFGYKKFKARKLKN